MYSNTLKHRSFKQKKIYCRARRRVAHALKKKKNKLPEGFQQITWWWEVGGSRVGDQLVHGFSYLLMVR